MARDNHAHYARIGFVVAAGIAAIVITLIYLGGFHDKRNEFLVETYYDYAVNGLSIGSPVNLFGVKVGEVREISFTSYIYETRGAGAEDMRRVRIVMALVKKMLGYGTQDDDEIREQMRKAVENGLRATVTTSGITGLSRVDFKIDENALPPPKTGWVSIHPLVPPTPSLIDSFSVAATKLMNRLKTMDFDAVWSNVNRVADAAARTAENADAMLESSRAGIHQIVSDVGEASAACRELSQALKDNPSLLLRPADPQPLPETAR